jgi:hypothetical protein
VSSKELLRGVRSLVSGGVLAVPQVGG